MSKVKAKTNAETESDESNQQSSNLDLSLIRQPIATSVTGFEEVLRAYEAGTNEVSSKVCKALLRLVFIDFCSLFSTAA